MLGYGDKALELFRIINPIEHSKTKEAVNKYKVEPYAISADIYGTGNLVGRGGWTWYTGSSGWFYKTGIEYILGIKINHNILEISPCIPSFWKEYKVCYKFGNSLYNIKVKNPNGKSTGINKVTINGEIVENKIKLNGDRNVYNIEAFL
jgi:cellobiose phosphorylase